MIKKLMRNTAAAAGFAALLLVGACASNDGLGDRTDVSDDVVQVRPEQSGQESTVYPAPGPAKVDSDGNVYASSAAPGTGNAASVGTNTNVNVIPQRSTVEVTETTALVDTTATIETAPVVETTTTTRTTTVPMTSSIQEDRTTTTTIETEEEPVRTRMRKD